MQKIKIYNLEVMVQNMLVIGLMDYHQVVIFESENGILIADYEAVRQLVNVSSDTMCLRLSEKRWTGDNRFNIYPVGFLFPTIDTIYQVSLKALVVPLNLLSKGIYNIYSLPQLFKVTYNIIGGMLNGRTYLV